MAETTVLPNPLREGLRIRKTPEPCAMVIFGASGDLTQRKLVPALFYLARERLLPAEFTVIGCSKTPYTHEQFRQKMRKALKEFSSLSAGDESLLESFTKGLFYISEDFSSAQAYGKLGEFLEQMDRERGTGGNRLFYLSTPPSFFPVIVQHLGTTGLARPKFPGKSWTRIVIEKPFGRDLGSAESLNRTMTDRKSTRLNSVTVPSRMPSSA